MTLVEYVASLQDQNVPESEWFDKVQQWKKENNYEDPNAVKTKDVASQTDANVTSTKTPEASETLSAVENMLKKSNIQSVYGSGILPSPKGKQSFDLVGRTAEQVSGIVPIFQGVDLNPGETKKANNYEYKYEVDENKQPVFYTKPEGQEDWINVTANKEKDKGSELAVAQELGFNVGDFDKEKELKRKKIKKDFSVGDILSNAKLEPPKPYIEEVGKFLGPSEIEARQKAQKARIAIGVEDLDLDKKISNAIYEDNLDVDNFYSQFKDTGYSGKHSVDLNPEINKVRFFQDFNPDKINNFADSDNFLGFLNEKGYLNNYVDNYYDDAFGNLGTYDISAEEYDQLEIARQRKLDNYFNLYIQDSNSQYTKKVLLSYIVKNKDKFKNVKSLDEAYNEAKKYFNKEYGQSEFELISYSSYNAYRQEQFPELIAAEKRLQAAKKAKSEELIKEGSSEGLLQDSFTKFYDGVMSRASEQAYEFRDLLGFDTGVGRNLQREEDILKSAEDVRYGYIEGKKAEVDGVEYIKDSNGSIYNVTNKVIFVPSSKEELEKINKALDESEETDSSFSTAGSTEQFFATSGTMLFDIASIYGVGKVTKATKLGTLTNAIRIPKASFDTMSYYTFAGYVSSKKNIYEELIAAGVNETEARAIAEEGARVAGLWTGGTSLIAPVPSYLKQFDKILGNRSILQSAIKGYKKNGPTGFLNNFKETLKNIKITKDGVIKTGIAGTQEFAQEQVQQYGEYTGVNAYINRLLGKDILKETYDRQDFINTGIVSFASGSAFANLNIPGFKPSAAQQLNNLYLLGKDTTQTQKLLNEMVAEGKATQEEAGKVMSGIRSVKNQMSRIPASISAETKLESARLQQDIADLQAKKSRTDKVYHASIDSQIDAKKKELAEVVKPELEKTAARKGSKIAAEQLGAGFENFSTQQDMDSAAEGLREDGWEVQDSTGYGMALTKGKQKIILINDQAAAEDNRYTTDQHEVLHPFWEAALKANPKAAIDLGKALMVEIINNKDINAGTELLSRFSRYLSDENYSAENTWEEVIPLVSEALSNGDITYNKKQEAWWKNLGTKISDFLKGNKKPLSLEFNTGKDVFDFIEGYNKSIEAGKGLTKQQLEVAEKGAKGKLIEEGFDKESTYTVKEGETIQDVADKFDTTAQNLKDLNKISGVDLKAGDNLIVDAGVKIVERASDIKAAQQVEKTVAKESKRKLTPEQDKQAQNKVKEIQELQKESEALAKKYKKYKKDSEGNVLKDKQGNPVLDVIKGAKQQRLETELAADIKPIVDSFVESRTKVLYDPIPADAKKGVTRQEFIQSMKSDISTMINNEFEAKQPLEKFITSRGFLRANSLAQRLGIKSAEQGIDQDIDTASNITTKTDGDTDANLETETRTAQLPRATTKFTPDFVVNLDVNTEGKTEAEINEEVQKQFDEAIAKDLKAMGPVTTFGQTKNIGPALAALMEKATQGRTEVDGKIVKTPGMPAKVFTDKTKNIAKKDATSGALTAVKQYLDANAQRDFNNLPDAFAPGTGKATFIPENVKKALYKKNDKGQFILDKSKTLNDYKDLLGEMEKPVYRASEAQTIKGLIALSLRNRIFEQAVPDAVARSTTGVKFSKKINTEQQIFEDKQLNDLFKSVSQARSIIDVAKIIGVKGKITVNDSNRAQKQEQMLDFIKTGSIPSAVFEMAKFQNFARRKVNGVYVDLPARGGLYYGKSDPAYQAALNAAKENDSKYPDLAKPKRVNVNKAFTKEGIKQSKENTKFLNSFVNILNDAVNKNNLPIEIAALYITSGYQATTGIIKIAAPFKYKSTKFEYAGKDASKASDNKGEKFREEHTIPASVIGANIILAIQKNAVKPTMKAIEKNYFQVKLSKKDDTKLDKAGLDSTLFENQTIFDSPISRLAGAGINLQTIINPLNGKTIAEENGVGINSKIYNSLGLDAKTQASVIQNEQIKKGALDESYNVKKAIDLLVPLSENKAKASKRNSDTQPSSLQEEFVPVEKSIENLDVLDSALNQARRPDAPVKKIRVFDFDDTLARSKSKVLYTVPNVEGGFSEGATKLKAIFMVGGPGAGKTNVGKGLQLGRRGYKVVNQDIALEAMKAEAGLPAKESDYTAEQRSTRSKLGAAARKAAVAKFDKYAAAGNGMVIDGTGASYNATTKKIKALQDAGYEVHMVVATTPLETAIERNKARAERSLPDFVVEKTYNQVQESLAKYRKDFGDRLYEINTETIEYGKPLPNDFLQQVYAGINANKVGKINATQFAEQASTLEAQGAEFNFSEFSKVVEGKRGPLFSVAEKIAKARGTDDIFILTARPQDAAGSIQAFMKANGIDIPLQNITGLGDGTAAAKGRWIASKAAEGYNDFYFADDAIKNVQAVKDVLSQVDVKSKVQQAKASKRIVFDKVFNDIIEQKTGIESYKHFSAAKAKTVGSSKGKFTFFTTPSAEDFVGLLYKTLGKGKVGDAQMAFYKENLIDPYNRAEMAISQAKVAAGRDYKALKKKFKSIPKTLEKETGIAKYTYQHAIRTYIWDSQGIEVPGLSKRDQKRLTDFIKADPDLQAFADQLVNIQKGKPYPKPDKDWTAGNITTDVISGINKVNRAEYLQEWQENVDIIFSEKNMNKLEAAFGVKYVEALKDSLRAMKSGSNRPLGGDRVSNQILDWLNNSVGAIMFLNTRSAVLQTISAVNFINWGDNNILKAGKAFANQKQFWGDFLTLMNSDYLLERRDGLKINVSESEIADAVEGSKNKVNAAISYLLNKGFVFTRYADSFAIASGGATFYRNRIESLVEQGMDRKLAEQQAFEDFRLIAEENQQSSSPMRISQQQRSLIGRIVLQFGNTQLQYVRIQKRAVQDLVNGRGDWRANISKIVYYGAIQNLMFNALQSGLAWALFDDDEDDEELTEKNKEQKLERALNGAIDSQLKGLGIQGAVIAGVKNALLTIAEQTDKKSPKFEEALDDLLSIAPALGSKIRKLKSAARTVSWNRKEIKEKGFSMDNPAYLAGAQTISAIFNIPLDRAVMKMNNMRNILNPATQNWQKVALALGWSGWDVGLPYFGLAEDKPVLTETEKQTKKLFDLNKSDQVKMLLDLGLTKKEIRALTKEEQRVKEIIKLQNKNKDAGSKK